MKKIKEMADEEFVDFFIKKMSHERQSFEDDMNDKSKGLIIPISKDLAIRALILMNRINSKSERYFFEVTLEDGKPCLRSTLKKS